VGGLAGGAAASGQKQTVCVSIMNRFVGMPLCIILIESVDQPGGEFESGVRDGRMQTIM
jgi:hypothetical protein